MKDDAVNLLKSEFRLWGVKFEQRVLNSGHVEIVWRATPDKETRRYIVPKTPGEYRGWLNARSKIRQLFKADGLVLKQEIVKPKPLLAKALSMPEPIEKDSDQIKLLRAEIAELTDLVLELASTMSEMKKIAEDAKVAAAPPLPPLPPIAIIEEKPSQRSIKAMDYLTLNWCSTEALARDMGLEPNMAYRKLYYLIQKGTAEHHQGLWRKKRADTIPAGLAAKNRNGSALNGHGRGQH